MSLVGRTLAGRYRLTAVLGAGGMATVYRARDERLDREVALKALSPNLAADETVARRFEREARALAAVSHPAVVAVYDVGEERGEMWFVMELVEGDTLADKLEREGPLAPTDAVPVLVSTAQGLGALHAEGLIHRDVKPHNVLLTEGGTAKLADFGVVRGSAASDLTAPGTTLGTLAYLAPEVLAGEPATPASDVYALGAVAYEALTGRRPYPADTITGLVDAQAGPPPAPSVVAPWLARGFDEPLLRALGPAVDRPDLGTFATSLAVAEGAWRAAGAAPVRAGHAAVVPTSAVTRAITRTVTRALEGRSDLSWPPFVVGGLLALLLVGAVALAPGLLGPSATEPRPSSSAEPSPSGVATSPSGVASTDDLRALVAQVGRLIDEAQRGPGDLKGKEAKGLRDRLAEVSRRLDEGDLSKALESADKLVEEIDKLREKMDPDTGDQLLAAADRLRDAIEARSGEEGE
jgi:serine/threonine-protein kinase